MMGGSEEYVLFYSCYVLDWFKFCWMILWFSSVMAQYVPSFLDVLKQLNIMAQHVPRWVPIVLVWTVNEFFMLVNYVLGIQVW